MRLSLSTFCLYYLFSLYPQPPEFLQCKNYFPLPRISSNFKLSPQVSHVSQGRCLRSPSYVCRCYWQRQDGLYLLHLLHLYLVSLNFYLCMSSSPRPPVVHLWCLSRHSYCVNGCPEQHWRVLPSRVYFLSLRRYFQERSFNMLYLILFVSFLHLSLSSRVHPSPLARLFYSCMLKGVPSHWLVSYFECNVSNLPQELPLELLYYLRE